MSTEHPLYFDYNATTPILPEVVDAMLPWLRREFGNPSSGHAWGRRARAAVDEARAQVATLIHASADEVFFTSGGTESNNLAIVGVARAASPNGRRGLVSSVIEHPATLAPARHLEREGYSLALLGVDPFGRIRLDEAAAQISADTLLVTLMLANNETGVLQPISAISQLTRAAGALLHTDAAQSVGKVPVDVSQLGVDLLTIAGHKLYAPKGVGALYVRTGTPITPLVLGAPHERGLRPGTENVPYLVALGTACSIAARDLSTEFARQRGLRDRLHSRLTAAVAGLALNGSRDERLPNTLNVRFPQVTGSALLAAIPELAASTGSACHAGHETASAVILAMGISEGEAVGSVRLTIGRGTTEAEVDQAAELLAKAWRELQIHQSL